MNKKIKDFYVKKMQKIIIVSVVIVFISMSVCGCTRKEDVELLKLSMEETPLEYGADVIQTATDGKSEYSDEEYTATDDEPVMIQVHICGAVNNPGVYGLPKGSRIYEAVEAAGGFSPGACENYVNLAQILTDASKIMIPTTTEVEDGSLFLQDISGQDNPDGKGLVNINIADVSELCTLPGIGESKAEAIVSYRNKNGQFNSIEQIMEVEGIKSGMYSKIQDKICVK